MECKRRTRIVGLVLCSIGLHGIASAQTADPKSPKDVIAKFSADLSIPDSPAAAALGITASPIVIPHDPRELAVSLANVLGARSGQGVATDVSPVLLFAGRSYSIGEYEQNMLLRAGIRTTIGVAGAKQTIAGSDYSGTSISLSTVFLNAGDPVLDSELRDCVNKAQVESVALKREVEFQKPDTNSAMSEITEIPIRDEDALNDPNFAAAVKKCFSQANSRNWNRSRIAAGYWTSRSDPITAGLPRASAGNTGWITVQYGFDAFKPVKNKEVDTAARSRSLLKRLEASGSVVVHYRYTHGASDVSQIPSGSFPEMNKQLLGGRFTYGSETRAAYAEVNRSWKDLQGGTSGDNGGAVGGSFRINKDLWFNVAIGRRQEFSDTGGTSVSASFKYGSSSEPLVPSR